MKLIDTLLSKRKINLIMRSKAALHPIIKSGALDLVFVQNGHVKRGKRLSLCIVTKSDIYSGTVKIPGLNGHQNHCSS